MIFYFRAVALGLEAEDVLGVDTFVDDFGTKKIVRKGGKGRDGVNEMAMELEIEAETEALKVWSF